MMEVNGQSVSPISADGLYKSVNFNTNKELIIDNGTYTIQEFTYNTIVYQLDCLSDTIITLKSNGNTILDNYSINKFIVS
jgi:hypothetical protein